MRPVLPRPREAPRGREGRLPLLRSRSVRSEDGSNVVTHWSKNDARACCACHCLHHVYCSTNVPTSVGWAFKVFINVLHPPRGGSFYGGRDGMRLQPRGTRFDTRDTSWVIETHVVPLLDCYPPSPFPRDRLLRAWVPPAPLCVLPESLMWSPTPTPNIQGCSSNIN